MCEGREKAGCNIAIILTNRSILRTAVQPWMEFGCGGVLEGESPLGEGTSGPAAVRASHLSAAFWLQMCSAGGRTGMVSLTKTSLN